MLIEYFFKINWSGIKASYIEKTKPHLITRIEENKTAKNTKKKSNDMIKQKSQKSTFLWVAIFYFYYLL